jgi:hypothetical protein
MNEAVKMNMNEIKITMNKSFGKSTMGRASIK